MADDYEIIIIGSGIAGSTLGLVLGSLGISTLVVERKSHPRFAIGESTVPTTTLLFNYLARRYDVPELADVCHYLGLREHGCTGWPKQVFWYGVHQEHRPLSRDREVMFEAILLPNGPDVHMLRADADAFLVSRFGRYGVAYEDHTEVLDIQTAPRGAEVRVRGPAGERTIRARFVVDASGHASLLAARDGLRETPTALRTNTRTIFGHFDGVPDLDDVLEGQHPRFRFKRDGGTMHHCFPGGWGWVIPFDNGTTSVGIQFDRRMYPLDPTVPTEVELRDFLARFPSMQAHLGPMQPTRPLVRTDRIQFTSNTILGDRFILTPHAAAFIEPLFSTGIVLTASFIARFVPALVDALRADDFSRSRFRPIERAFFAEVRQIDRLVDGVIQSFRDFDVFKQYWRNWVSGTLAQFGESIVTDGAPATPMLYGAGVPGFSDAVEEMYAAVTRAPSNEVELAQWLQSKATPWYDRICLPVLDTQGKWTVRAGGGCSVVGATSPEPVAKWLERLARTFAEAGAPARLEHADAFMQRTRDKLIAQIERYRRDDAGDSGFRRAYERILANENPDMFDYRDIVGLR